MALLLISAPHFCFATILEMEPTSSFSSDPQEADSATPPIGSKFSPEAMGKFMEKHGLFPVLAWSPETRGIIGLYQQKIFRDSNDQVQQLALWVMVTMNKQVEVGLRPELRFADDQWRFRGELSYQKWPDSYYGQGALALDESLDYGNERLKCEGEILRQVGSAFYLGLSGRAEHNRFYDYGTDNEFAGFTNGLVDAHWPAREDGFCKGLGAVLLWDTRNRDVAPSQGQLIEWRSETLQFDEDRKAGKHQLNARGYRPFGTSVLAGQFILADSGGEPNFRYLNRPGEFLRALPEMMYINRSLLVLRGELRQKLSDRFGFVAFAGQGFSAGEPWKLDRGDKHLSLGLGARIVLDPKNGLNVAVDMAWGEEGLRSFIKVGEEF